MDSCRPDLGLGQGLQGLLGQAQIFAGGDFQVDRRAGHDRHLVADPLDQLRVVGGLKALPLGVGIEQQIAAEDLRRLGLPKALAGDGLFDLVIRAHPFQRAGHGNGENGRAGLLGGRKNPIDPLVANARPGGVVDADEIGLRLHPGQRRLDRVGPLRAAVDHLDAQNGDIRGELEVEILPILGRDDQNRLHHVVAAQKPLGRVQPDGLVGQWERTVFYSSCP